MGIWDDVKPPDLTLEAYDPRWTFLNVDIDGGDVASYDIVDVTEAGVLIAVAFDLTELYSGSNHASRLGTTVDGNTEQFVDVVASAVSWSKAGVGMFAQEGIANAGQALNDNMYIPFGSMRYGTSLKVRFDVTAVNLTAGQMRIAVLRGKKL